ncbi:MAG: flagellin [bacterium]
MIISTNVAALAGFNRLRLIDFEQSTTLERLSSGLRINRAADDPSGLALSTGMSALIRGSHKSIENMEDTINMFHTAEAAMEETGQILNRLRDLSLRSANEAVMTTADRDRIQSEIDSLVDAVNQLALLTTFNTKKVVASEDGLNTKLAAINVTDWVGSAGLPGAGDAGYEAMKRNVMGAIEAAMEKVYGMIGISPSDAATLDVTFAGIDGAGGTLALGGGAPNAMQITIDVIDFFNPGGPTAVGYDPSVNSFTPEMVVAHEMTHAVVAGNGGGAGSSWGQEMLAVVVSQEMDLRIKANPAGVIAAIGGPLISNPISSEEYAEVALAGNFIYRTYGSDALNDVVKGVTDGGLDFDASIMSVLGDYYAAFADFEAAADAAGIQYAGGGGGGIVYGIGWTAPNSEMTTGFVGIQSPYNKYYANVGPDSDSFYQLAVQTPWTPAGSLDYLPFVNAATTDKARASIETIDNAIGILAEARAFMGMQENRLRSALNDLQTHAINLTAARSRILDADMAVEMTSFTRNSILMQGAAAALAQANAQPSLVLSLLGR